MNRPTLNNIPRYLTVYFFALFLYSNVSAEEVSGFGPYMSDCFRPIADIEVQIAACEAALQFEELDETVQILLPSIISILRGEVNTFRAASFALDLNDPAGLEVFYSAAIAQYQAERHDRALVLFVVAKTLYPRIEDAHVVWEGFAWKLQDMIEADPMGVLHAANFGLGYFPSDPSLFVLRAMALMRMGDTEQAIAAWDSAVQSTLFPYLFKLFKAESLWENGAGPLALEELNMLQQQVQAGGPVEQYLIRLRGLSHPILVSRIDEHIENLPEKHKLTYRLLAEINFELNDHREALLAVDGWLRLHPKSFDAVLLKSQILAGLGRRDEAENWFDKAVSEGRALAHQSGGRERLIALSRRAEFYESIGEYELAERDANDVFTSSNHRAVKALQGKLQFRGLYHGPIHGHFDDETMQAVSGCIPLTDCALGDIIPLSNVSAYDSN